MYISKHADDSSHVSGGSRSAKSRQSKVSPFYVATNLYVMPYSAFDSHTPKHLTKNSGCDDDIDGATSEAVMCPDARLSCNRKTGILRDDE